MGGWLGMRVIGGQARRKRFGVRAHARAWVYRVSVKSTSSPMPAHHEVDEIKAVRVRRRRGGRWGGGGGWVCGCGGGYSKGRGAAGKLGHATEKARVRCVASLPSASARLGMRRARKPPPRGRRCRALPTAARQGVGARPRPTSTMPARPPARAFLGRPAHQNCVTLGSSQPLIICVVTELGMNWPTPALPRTIWGRAGGRAGAWEAGVCVGGGACGQAGRHRARAEPGAWAGGGAGRARGQPGTLCASERHEARTPLRTPSLGTTTSRPPARCRSLPGP